MTSPMADRRRRSLFWAATSLLSMMLLLFIIAGVSDGFRGLSGVASTMAFSGMVMIPLILVAYLALRRSAPDQKEPALKAIRVPSKNR